LLQSNSFITNQFDAGFQFKYFKHWTLRSGVIRELIKAGVANVRLYTAGSPNNICKDIS